MASDSETVDVEGQSAWELGNDYADNGRRTLLGKSGFRFVRVVSA